MDAVITATPPLDIRYLLFLQDFRNSIDNALTPFMEQVSLFAVTYLIMIPVLFYWMLSKKDGFYPLVSYYLACGVNAVVKLTVCAYRPWIRDPRVIPAGDAITTATGYSFPSGHTVTATPIYGGLAVTSWKKDKWFSVLCVLFILLTGFSRNYLGVHTPQDVAVALLVSVVCLYAAARVMAWLAEHPEQEDWFLLGGFLICWAGIAYITLKPYPMDLDPQGKLLVDPRKMMEDGYGDIGKLMGFLIGRFVEKHWIRFRPLKLSWKSVLICLAGLVPLVLLKQFVRRPITGMLGTHWGNLVFSILYAFYYIALFPLVLKLCGRSAALGGEPAAAKA